MSRAKGSTKGSMKGTNKEVKVNKANVAKEEKKLLAILNETLPPEKVRAIKASNAAFQEAMTAMTKSAAQTTRAEVNAVILAANIAARMKDPGSAPPRVRPQTDQEREIERNLQEALDGYSLSSMEEGERHQIQDLLQEYGLSIDKSRGLEYRCHYKVVPVHGAKTQAQLESFLDEHKAHHLAIFSVERQPEGLSCFYIEDLIKYIKRVSNTDSDASLQLLSEEYWESTGVTVNGVRFTGAEVLLAVQWGAAYAKLRELLADTSTLPDGMRRSLLKVSSALVPTKRLGRWRTFYNQARGLLRGMWHLIGMKIALDFLSRCACVFALCYGYFGKARDFVEVAWAVSEGFMGMLMCMMQTYVGSILESYIGPALTYALGAFTTALKALGFTHLVTVVSMWVDALKPENIQNKYLKGAVIGGTYAATAILKRIVVGGLMAALNPMSTTSVLVGATAVFSTATLLPIAIGAIFSMYVGNTSMFALPATQLSGGGLNSNIVTILLPALTTGIACDFLGKIFGRKAGKVCSKSASLAVQMFLNYAILNGILDLLKLLVRLTYPELVKDYSKTNCELELESLLASNFSKATLQAAVAEQDARARAEELYALLVQEQDPYLKSKLSQEAVSIAQSKYDVAQKSLEASNSSLKIAAEDVEKAFVPAKGYTIYDKALAEANQKGLDFDHWKVRHELLMEATQDQDQGTGEENKELFYVRGEMSKARKAYEAAKHTLKQMPNKPGQPATKFYVLGEKTEKIRQDLEEYKQKLEVDIIQRNAKRKTETEAKLETSQAKVMRNSAYTAKKELDEIKLELFRQNAILQALQKQKQELTKNKITLDQKAEDNLKKIQNDIEALEIKSELAIKALNAANLWFEKSSQNTRNNYKPPPEHLLESEILRQKLNLELNQYTQSIQDETTQHIKALKAFQNAESDAKKAAKLAKNLGTSLENYEARLQILKEVKKSENERGARVSEEFTKELKGTTEFVSTLKQQHNEAVANFDILNKALESKAQAAKQPLKGFKAYTVDFTPEREAERKAELEEYKSRVKKQNDEEIDKQRNKRNTESKRKRMEDKIKISKFLTEQEAREQQKREERIAKTSSERQNFANHVRSLDASIEANNEIIKHLEQTQSTDDVEDIKRYETEQLVLKGNRTEADNAFKLVDTKYRRLTRQAQQIQDEVETGTATRDPLLQKKVDDSKRHTATRTQQRQVAEQVFEQSRKNAQTAADELRRIDLEMTTNNLKKDILNSTYPEAQFGNKADDEAAKLGLNNAQESKLLQKSVINLQNATKILETAAKNAKIQNYQKVEAVRASVENLPSELQAELSSFKKNVTNAKYETLMDEFTIAKAKEQEATTNVQKIGSQLEELDFNIENLELLKNNSLITDGDKNLTHLIDLKTNLMKEHDTAVENLKWIKLNLQTAAEDVGQPYETSEEQKVVDPITVEKRAEEKRRVENFILENNNAKTLAKRINDVETTLNIHQTRLNILNKVSDKKGVLSPDHVPLIQYETEFIRNIQTDLNQAKQQLNNSNGVLETAAIQAKQQFNKVNSNAVDVNLQADKLRELENFEKEVESRAEEHKQLLHNEQNLETANLELKQAFETTTALKTKLSENEQKLEIFKRANFDLETGPVDSNELQQLKKEKSQLENAIKKAKSDYQNARADFEKKITAREQAAKKITQVNNVPTNNLDEETQGVNVQTNLAEYETATFSKAHSRRFAELAEANNMFEQLNLAAQKTADFGSKVDANREKLAVIMRYPEASEFEDTHKQRKDLSENILAYERAVEDYNVYKNLFNKAASKADVTFGSPLGVYKLGQKAPNKEVTQLQTKISEFKIKSAEEKAAKEKQEAEEKAKREAAEAQVAAEAATKLANFQSASYVVKQLAKQTEIIGKRIEQYMERIRILKEEHSIKHVPLNADDYNEINTNTNYIEELQEEYNTIVKELRQSNETLKSAAQNGDFEFKQVKEYTLGPKIHLLSELSDYKTGVTTRAAQKKIESKQFEDAYAAFQKAANETERLGVELDTNKMKLEIWQTKNQRLNKDEIKQKQKLLKIQNLEQRYQAAVQNYDSKNSELMGLTTKMGISRKPLEKYTLGASNEKVQKELEGKYTDDTIKEADVRSQAEAATKFFKGANEAATKTIEIGPKLDTEIAMLDILLNQSQNLDESVLKRVAQKRENISNMQMQFDAAVKDYNKQMAAMNEEASKVQMNFQPLEVYKLINGVQNQEVKTFQANILAEALQNVRKKAESAAEKTKSFGRKLKLAQQKLNSVKIRYNILHYKEFEPDIDEINNEIRQLEKSYNVSVRELGIYNSIIKGLTKDKHNTVQSYDSNSDFLMDVNDDTELSRFNTYIYNKSANITDQKLTVFHKEMNERTQKFNTEMKILNEERENLEQQRKKLSMQRDPSQNNQTLDRQIMDIGENIRNILQRTSDVIEKYTSKK